MTLRKILTVKHIFLLIIFSIFLFANSLYINRVPGLMGDEGDEGQNISELLTNKKPPLVGERSYIGAWIDYIRMPFVFTLGHNALSLRLVTLIFSLALFWFTYKVLTRLFGEISGLMGLVAVAFSPIYFAEQRMAWAITLLPFFVILTIYFYQQKKKWSALLAGFAAGLGANTHILFIAILAGLVIAVIPIAVFKITKKFSRKYLKRVILSVFLAIVGFWAAFGVQYANLVIYKSDQGNAQKNAQFFTNRLIELPRLAPRFLSGSVYVAHYTSHLFTNNFNTGVWISLTALIIAGIIFNRKRTAIILWVLGTAVYLLALLYMIEYYALRYFVVVSLSIWLLAGVGLGSILDRYKLRKIGYLLVITIGLFLVLFNFQTILIPFMKTGGSTDNFQIIGERYENASGLVDLNPLISCIANRDNVFSNNINIRNRLYFLAEGNKSIKIATEKYGVQWLIRYRMPNDKISSNEACPDLLHFSVTPTTDNAKEVEWPKD